MGGIFEVGNLEARKRALAAESEVYRQTLTLELQNLRLYSAGVKRRFALFSAARPVLMFVLPWAASIIRGKRRRRMGLLKLGLIGWRAYRELSPFLRMFRQRSPGQDLSSLRQPAEEHAPAAHI